MANILKALDLSMSAFVFGATVWFFFVQSPFLIAKLGREKFIPLQIGMTKVLFTALFVVTILLTIVSRADMSALIAMVGAGTNLFVILPKAFRAAGKSLAEIKGKDSRGSVADFADHGAGEATTVYHRLVVLFVIVVLVGVVAHSRSFLA